MADLSQIWQQLAGDVIPLRPGGAIAPFGTPGATGEAIDAMHRTGQSGYSTPGPAPLPVVRPTGGPAKPANEASGGDLLNKLLGIGSAQASEMPATLPRGLTPDKPAIPRGLTPDASPPPSLGTSSPTGGTGLLQTPQGRDMLSALWHGTLHGLANTGHGIYQLAAHLPVHEMGEPYISPEEEAQGQQNIDAAERQRQQNFQQSPEAIRNPVASKLGELTGEVVPAAALSFIPGVGAVGGGALRSGVGLLARGAALGGAGAATAPVTGTKDYWDEKAEQIGLGAATGAAIPAIGSAMAPRLVAPQLIEQRVLQNFRPLRNFVTGAEERTVDGFDRTIARQVLDPIGGDVPRNFTGHKLNSHVEDAISAKYDQLLPNLTLSRGSALTHGTQTDSGKDLSAFVSELSADDGKRYTAIIQNRLLSKFPESGIMDGRTYKKIQSDLTSRGVGFLGTNSNDLGQALLLTVDHLNGVLQEENPQFAGQLGRINASWKLWTRMRAAANNATGEGKFTPSQLLRAIRTQDRSAGKGTFAKGDAVLQGYSEAGEKALDDRKVTPADLLKLFTRHGLPGELIHGVLPPIGRALKRATPYIAPSIGRLEGDIPR